MTSSFIVVVKAIIMRKGKVLLLKRSSTDEVGAGQWDTAGGKLEFGEELETALVREVREEAGIEAQVKRLLYASTFFTDSSSQIVLLSYLCTSEEEEIVISDEHSDYVWASQALAATLMPANILEEWNQHQVMTLDEWNY